MFTAFEPLLESRNVVRISPPDFTPGPNVHQLATYVAELELEVDRLRKQYQYLRHACTHQLDSVRGAIKIAPPPVETSLQLHNSIEELAELIGDLDDSPAVQPSEDQVTTITVRPLVEQVFRWQQRLAGAPHVILHLELSAEFINWFPARLRHILDNLVSNALKYRDPQKGQSRVSVMLNHRAESIEVRVTDNGLGLPHDNSTSAAAFLNQSAHQRSPGTGVGLAVVKLLIEQSGGSLSVESNGGNGAQFVAILPRYDVGDFLT